MRMAIVAFGAMLFCGCNGELLKIDPFLAAPLVEQGASVTTSLALKALVSDAESFDKAKATAQVVREVMENSIVPLIAGVPLSEVTRATVDAALKQFGEKIPVEYRGVIQLAINGALAVLKLPDNPAAKLDKGYVHVILALFRGIGTGIAAFQNWVGPGARAMGDIPPILELNWAGGKIP